MHHLHHNVITWISIFYQNLSVLLIFWTSSSCFLNCDFGDHFRETKLKILLFLRKDNDQKYLYVYVYFVVFVVIMSTFPYCAYINVSSSHYNWIFKTNYWVISVCLYYIYIIYIYIHIYIYLYLYLYILYIYTYICFIYIYMYIYAIYIYIYIYIYIHIYTIKPYSIKERHIKTLGN